MEANINRSPGQHLTIKQLRDFYQDRKILVTGHTGFKGSWLCLWLTQMGCKVAGYSLPPEKTPDNLFLLTKLSEHMRSHEGDIREFPALRHFMQDFKPEIIFHLAAQSLVLPSYEAPIETYATNVMGTVHVLEAVRQTGGVKAVVNATTDKCYENTETAVPFREEDPLGGHDPYSSSKAAAEIVSAGYRRSFLAKENIHMATVRAGNVIGGGDFSRHRLIPDIIRAAKSAKPVNLRHPESVRPWQHVFDVLHGYLMLGQALYEKGETYAQPFNFGPDQSGITVGEIADQLTAAMDNPPQVTRLPVDSMPEAKMLNLDNRKAKSVLGWRPLLAPHAAIDLTAAWYRHYLSAPNTIAAFTLQQLTTYSSGSSE